jgi:hypothetical protein
MSNPQMELVQACQNMVAGTATNLCQISYFILHLKN